MIRSYDYQMIDICLILYMVPWWDMKLGFFSVRRSGSGHNKPVVDKHIISERAFLKQIKKTCAILCKQRMEHHLAEKPHTFDDVDPSKVGTHSWKRQLWPSWQMNTLAHQSYRRWQGHQQELLKRCMMCHVNDKLLVPFRHQSWCQWANLLVRQAALQNRVGTLPKKIRIHAMLVPNLSKLISYIYMVDI